MEAVREEGSLILPKGAAWPTTVSDADHAASPLMQLFYNLSDPAMEDALYKIESMRHFAGLKMDRLPDETTILKFRHVLERYGLGKVLFEEVNKYMEKKGLMLREGCILDAFITSAPSSTKIERD